MDAGDAARAHGLAEYHLNGRVQRHVMPPGWRGRADDDGWSRRRDRQLHRLGPTTRKLYLNRQRIARVRGDRHGVEAPVRHRGRDASAGPGVPHRRKPSLRNRPRLQRDVDQAVTRPKGSGSAADSGGPRHDRIRGDGRAHRRRGRDSRADRIGPVVEARDQQGHDDDGYGALAHRAPPTSTNPAQ